MQAKPKKKTQLKGLLSPCQAFNSKDFVGYTMLMGLVLASALGVVYTKHQTRSQYASLQQLQYKRDNLHVEWSQLLLEKGTWANDARVERVAREKLNMEIPIQNQIIVIQE